MVKRSEDRKVPLNRKLQNASSVVEDNTSAKMGLVCSQLQIYRTFMSEWRNPGGLLPAQALLSPGAGCVLPWPPAKSISTFTLPGGWSFSCSPQARFHCVLVLNILSHVSLLFSVFTIQQKHLWPEGFTGGGATFQRLQENFGRGCSGGTKWRRAKVEGFLQCSSLCGDCANLTDQGRGNRRYRNIS